MCMCCPGLRQNIHGASSCALAHGHTGDCSKSLTAEPPIPPWFVPVIAELLPATARRTAREMPRQNFTYVRIDVVGGGHVFSQLLAWAREQ
jgi:hypothetical protein